MNTADAGYSLCQSCNGEFLNEDLVDGICSLCREKSNSRCEHGKIVSQAICRRFHLGEAMKGDD